MSEQLVSPDTQKIIIQLEVVSEDEQQPNIADVEEVSREIVTYLRSNGFTVEPRYTGTKGIPDLDVILHVFHIIHGHEALAAAVFSFASSAIKGIIKVCTWRAEKDKTRRKNYEITLEVGDKPVTITSSDIEGATKLVEQLQRTYPEAAKQALSQNNMKIKVRVPKKERRRKH